MPADVDELRAHMRAADNRHGWTDPADDFVLKDPEPAAPRVEIKPEPAPEPIAAREPKPDPEPLKYRPIAPEPEHSEQEQTPCSEFTTVEEINREYAVVPYGGKVIVVKTAREHIEFQSVTGMHHWFANQRIKTSEKDKSAPAWAYWLKSPARRQYDRIVFRPGAKNNARELNLWSGWGLDAEDPKGRFEHPRITEHIEKVICANNKTISKYVMRWLAHMVQYPAEKPQIAVVLKGGTPHH